MATSVKKLSKRVRSLSRAKTVDRRRLRWIEQFPNHIVNVQGQIAALVTVADVLCEEVAGLLKIDPKQLQEKITARAQKLAEQLKKAPVSAETAK